MRTAGWERLLSEYIAKPQPFAWGQNDCALWAAEWVLKCTGQDFGGDWRGKYKTESGAARRMKRLGFEGVEGIADAHLEPRPVRMARRGDIVLHPDGMLGICGGVNSHFLTERGTTSIPTLTCTKAWAV